MDNKNHTIEELEEKYAACMKQCDMLHEQIEKKKKEEEKKLAKVKDARKKEIDDVVEHLTELVAAYIKDYGSYEYEEEDDDDGHSFSYHHHWLF